MCLAASAGIGRQGRFFTTALLGKPLSMFCVYFLYKMIIERKMKIPLNGRERSTTIRGGGRPLRGPGVR